MNLEINLNSLGKMNNLMVHHFGSFPSGVVNDLQLQSMLPSDLGSHRREVKATPNFRNIQQRSSTIYRTKNEFYQSEKKKLFLFDLKIIFAS